ncbi:MAG TPA: hypothetical protein VIG08_03525 [Gemmatimonadales bacterium]
MRARLLSVSISIVLLWTTLAPSRAAAQLGITLQGGIHAARLNRPERRLDQPARSIFLEGAAGEATTFGLRAGTWWSERLGLDAGVAWSRNRSFQGGFGSVAPDFENHTIFTSATIRARLTGPHSPIGLVAGVGPAVILHAGSGASLLSRSTDLGGLVNLGASVRVGPSLSLTTDVQQYFFSSRFAESYQDLTTGAIRPAGRQGRHEFVILAGVMWQAP